MSLSRSLLSAVMAFSTVLILSLVLSSISTSQSSSAATNPTTITADIIRVSFGLSIETEPSITLNVKPTPEGSMTVVGSTVTTGTSSPSGYTLYLQMTGENSNVNSLINSVDATATLTSSGSFTNPTTLASGTWGYAIPHEASSVLSTNNFDDSYTAVESVAQTGSKFAAIPTTNTPAEKIAETNSPSVVELPVYYGVMASYNTLSGSYSNKVLYTALADDTPIHTASVSPTSIFDEGAETLNVFTPLHTTNPDVVAEAYLLTPEQYANATRAENPVPISTYAANKMTCARTEADSVTLSCTTIPTTAGNAYVYVDIPGYNDHYDASITVKPKNLTITVQNTNTTSGTPSVTVPYGSSATVTVTPNAGYYLGGVTCPTGFTCTGYTTSTSATTQQTVTITHDDALTGGTIGFTGTTRSFTINITNSNTTSGSSSITVPYGGSSTVTVTPASNYYLSAVSCPSGYTCSGYSTGSTQTGTQTVTITNNNTAAGGTLGFTGTVILYMQDQANIDACKNAATGTTFTLTDSRDNNEYKVRKLADGKCWMTQNLRLQNKTISNADSNLPSSKTVTIPASSTADWCTENSAACDDQLMTLDATDTSISGQSSAQADYGVYYNWYTATATYGTYSMSSGSVSYDICPKGWRLPTGGSSGEFQTLYNNYNSSVLMQGDPAFVLSGYRYGGSTYLQGSLGYYWSSTALNASRAYSLYLFSSDVYPADYDGRYNGFSVRCVAQ